MATPTTWKPRYERRRRLEYGTFQLLQRPRDGERLSRSAKVTHSGSSSFHSVLPLSLTISSHTPFNSLARIQCANYLLTGDLFEFIQKSALPRPCYQPRRCFPLSSGAYEALCSRFTAVLYYALVLLLFVHGYQMLPTLDVVKLFCC